MIFFIACAPSRFSPFRRGELLFYTYIIIYTHGGTLPNVAVLFQHWPSSPKAVLRFGVAPRKRPLHEWSACMCSLIQPFSMVWGCIFGMVMIWWKWFEEVVADFLVGLCNFHIEYVVINGLNGGFFFDHCLERTFWF